MDVTKTPWTSDFSLRLFVCLFVFVFLLGGEGLVYMYVSFFISFIVDLTSVFQDTGKLYIPNPVYVDHMHVRMSPLCTIVN